MTKFYYLSFSKISCLIIMLLISNLYVSSQKKIYQSIEIQGEKPVIDGLLDEEIWQSGIWSGEFTQHSPRNGENPSQKTEFKILYDSRNLYVAIKAYDTEPLKIDRRLSRRDEWDGDWAVVGFDSYHDLRTSFVFGISASGVKSDGIISNDQQEPDDTWDPIWYVKTSITEYGWVAEMKIPLSQLRFNKGGEKWGLQVLRHLYRDQEVSLWQHVPADASGWISLFGEMSGLNNISSKKQVEVAPYLMGKIDNYEKDEDNPFSTGRDYSIETGVDGKIGISNDFILDFAINPDFGQVEADPSEVNLSAFETFLEEKRLFFVEGSNIITFPFTPGGSPWSADNLFYSRRIGRSPQHYPELSENEYADIPENTRILGAVKLSGKTKDGWSVGILESVTNKEVAIIDNDGNRREETIEPMTNYFLARVQKDINKGNTIIGGMFTSTYRNIESESENLDFLNKNATTGGIDFTQYFKARKYELSVNVAMSNITGTEEAMLEQQLSSRRYFQRPDADYLILDSTRTSLLGHSGKLMFSKNANSGLRYTGLVTWRSPGFETNDMGYLRRANSVFHYIWAGYSITKPFSVFRSVNINANEWAGWDFGGNNTFFGGSISVWTQFNNLWTLSANFSKESMSKDNTALRGGPALYMPGNWNHSFNIGSNSTKKLAAHFGMWNGYGNHNSGNSIFIWSNVSFRPHNTLEIGVYPNFAINRTELQYVTQESYNEEDKYVFSSMSQKTVNFVFRVNYSITPDLTIQFYGSPFVSSADYSDYKVITDPKADEFEDRFNLFDQNQISYITGDNQYGISESGSSNYDYFIANPDFNFRQYRSNLVVRWEYIPGSVFYFVWSQSKSDYMEEGSFNYLDDIGDLFSVSSRDILLVKFSYRFRT